MNARRRSPAILGLVIALTVVGITAAAGAPSGSVDLERTSSGDWSVFGVTPLSGEGGRAAGADALARTQVAEGPTLISAPAEGSRTTLVDSIGNFAGLVSGQLPDLDPTSSLDGATTPVQALSYVVDRAARTLKVVWVSVPGATTYEVRTEEAVLTTTAQTSATVPLDGLAPGAVVDVAAIGPVEGLPAPDVMATMSLVLGDYTTLWQTSLELSGADGALAAAAAPAKTTFTFQTFIPDNYVKAPLLCGGTVFPSNHYFKGDNRGFDVTSTRYRTKMVTELNWGNTDRKLRYVGQTKRYKLSNGVYSLVDAKTASSSGMSWYGPNTYTSTRKNFIAYHDVGNPYCLGGVGEIDYDVSVVVDRKAGYNGFTAWGDHDRAPNYAFYYKDSSTGTTHYRFRGWSRSSFSCLSACTQASFSVVK